MKSTIKVVSYNIHKGMSPFNRRVVLPMMADALSNLDADILCLQEVSGQNQKRSAIQDYPDTPQHAWLGDKLKLLSTYGKNCAYAHGHHGNATLSRHEHNLKHNLNISVNRLEKRGVLHTEILLPDTKTSIVVLNAHLNLLHKDRIKQYQAITDYIRHEIRDDMPLILAGDFNDWNKKSAKMFADLGLKEVFEHTHGKSFATYPARLPILSLDRIYIKNLNILETMVYRGAPWQSLSDHLPIGAVLGYEP